MNTASATSPASRDITIYSVAACPYAQRTRILLTIKNIDAKLVELDLSKKRPDWFLAINPAGKVPAIVHAGIQRHQRISRGNLPRSADVSC